MIFVSSGIFSTLQPTAQAAEEPYGLSIASLPSKGNPKLDSTMNTLTSGNGAVNSKSLTAQGGIPPGSNNVRVIIESLPGHASEVTSIAGTLGMVEGSYQNYIQMVVPTGNIHWLAAMGKVKMVREPMQPLVSAVTTEGLPLINADEWQAGGYDGTGVKIGILDVGFAGYTTRQAEGNLPSSITTWWAPGIGNQGTNNHGTACAEIVYDIAPGATYYLANFSTIVEYGNAVDWLISQGVDIISCSVSWPTGGPGDGTGSICQIVDIARTAGILWVQSAGNQAQRHWEGYWNNPDDNPFLNFSGPDEGNSISVNNGDTIVASLKWDDPWYTSSNDFDLLLVDNNDDIVAYSFNIQDGDDNPTEILSYTAQYTGNYHLYILSLAGSAIADFHLYSYYHNLEYRTPSGSLLVPADSFNTVTVGAVNYATPDSLEEFSSRGPTDDGRIKPDLVGPDRVTTATYGTGDFAGTSAAAPHAAGAAALVQQRYESYMPDQLQDFLEGRCVDLGETGRDNLSGNGRLNLGNAVDNYTLRMMVVGNGDVSPEVGQHEYPAGSSVNITATADPDWQFIKWTGEVEDANSANTTVLLDKDKTVQAEFNQTTDHYCLTSTVDSQGDIGQHSSIVPDSSDNPHISYYHVSNNEVRYTWWNGNTWQIEIVDTEVSTEPYVSLAIDNADTPHMSYQKNGGSPDLVYAKWNGSSWQIQTVDSLGSVGRGSSIQIDTQGYPHISYYDETNDNLKYAYWNGSKWVIETVDDGFFVGEETSLVLDSADKPHILYSAADTDSGAKYAKKTNGTWEISTVEVGSDFDVTISLALDSSDNPHIFGDKKSTDTLKYAYWDGSSWQSQDIPDTYATNGEGAITLDSANNPHILYYRDLEYDLMYTWWNGSGWQVITVDSTGNVGSSSSMAIDSTGIVHASYFDLTNVDLNYAKILNYHPNFLTISNNGDGTTDPLTGIHAYQPGETVDISVIPSTTWEFVSWTGDVTNPDSASTTVTMDTDKAVTANLVRVGSILQLSINGSGDVTPNPGIHTYPINETVALSAVPETGWEFVNWTGDVADPNSTNTTITMDTDKSVTANFEEIPGVVIFPDPNLEAVIREAIGKPAGDIYESDLQPLTSLSGMVEGIVDLTGLEYCVNLNTLHLEGNQISDLSPISGLSNLSMCYLHNNQISDISPLAGLTNLHTLYLTANQISDISPLTGLTSLTSLDASSNQISVISPLSSLSNLSSLSLINNQISDITPLAGLTNLSGLLLYDNQIEDISALENLPNLTRIYLHDNLITNIVPLVNNTNIATGDYVYLMNNPLDADSISMYIPILESRGATVFYDTMPFSVTTKAASGITGNSATLNGHLEMLDPTYPITVRFEWGDSPSNLIKTTTPQLLSASGDFSFNLNGLVPGQNYYFRAQGLGAITAVGDELEFATTSGGSTGGGGGGGGGGMVGVLAFGYNITSDGRLKSEARAISENAEAFLILAEGTYCLLDGFPLTFITIMPLSATDQQPPIPEGTHLVSRIFKLGPEGSTFDPAIKLLFNYKPDDIVEGFSEEDMYIATWDEANAQWIRLESQLIPENRQIMTEISGFSMYAVMVSPQPANISVTEVTAVPGEINEGESVTITASLINDGGLDGTYEAELTVNGEVQETKAVEVGSQDSASVTFELEGLASGTYQISVGGASVTLTVLPVKVPTPAAFTLGPLEITPEEVDIGEEVRISITVENTGETEGMYPVTCKINGEVAEEKEITLPGLSSDTVFFNLSFEEAGKQLIDVNEQLGSVIVNGTVPPTDQTPLPAGDNEPSTPTGEVAEVTEPNNADNTNTGSSWPIAVGITGGCLVLAVVTLYTVRRKRRATPENPPDSP